MSFTIPTFIDTPALDVAAIRERVTAQEQTPFIVKGLLEPGSLVVLAGEPKSGKSVLASHLAVAIATGKPWLNL